MLVSCLGVFNAVVAAPAMAETRTTTMTIAISDAQPLLGERVVLSAQFNPRPFEAKMSFFDDGTPIAGCTSLYLLQKCWTEFASPEEQTITATMTPSESEEEEFRFEYELSGPPQPLLVTPVPRGTTCVGASCATRLTATGSPQSWTVPAGISQATFVLRGAGGGPGDSEEASRDEGGSGGKVTATLPVSEGKTFALVIGQPGYEARERDAEVPGGYGGGGTGGIYREYSDGSGGGGSFLFAPSGSLLLAAGGGGGAGNLAPGGNGGRTGGEGEENGTAGGAGASETGPGLGAQGAQDGFGPTMTTLIEGRGGSGANAPPESRSGGGGGGGYYGGGGGGVGGAGAVSGGGGGSDFVMPAASGVIYQDGAGGAGGEDETDPGQPGSVEILYAPAAAVTTPASGTTSSVLPKSTETKASPGLHLSLYTHGGQGLINTHALVVKTGCGPVVCTVRAKVVIHVPGLPGLPNLVSDSTPVGADSVGKVAISVPTTLRRLLRHYLLRHPGARVHVGLTVTGTAGSAHETLAETLPMWTLRGFR